MIYRDLSNKMKISQLGFGCMRLPRDQEITNKLLRTAVEAGINYFDTAWVYADNEVMVGEALKPIRDKVMIATKLPLIKTKKKADFDFFLNDSLKRLQTDYIDNFLLHMVTTYENFMKFCDMGVLEWAERKKKEGVIHKFGFSFHGSVGAFKKVIDAYNWDFCQIQYNYLDVEYQAGTDGLRYAHSKGIPVIIMEPLRGGRLINIPKSAEKAFRSTNTSRTNAEWGLKWLWNQPEVTCVLSGMSTMEQLAENIRIASVANVGEMNEKELKTIKEVREIINKKMVVRCTGCEYCMPCPQNVNIPLAFSFLNGVRLASLIQPLWMNYALHMGKYADKPQFASQCIACGKCMRHCPQNINIPQELRRVVAKYERIPPQFSIFMYNMGFLIIHDWMMCKIPDFIKGRNRKGKHRR